LGLGHEDEAHPGLLHAVSTVEVDTMIDSS
jgi:hypothetical protein